VVVGGFLIGILPYFVMFLIAFERPALSDLKAMVVMGGYGALGALVFWLTLRKLGALEIKPEIAVHQICKFRTQLGL
jgi:hypothetical protein